MAENTPSAETIIPALPELQVKFSIKSKLALLISFLLVVSLIALSWFILAQARQALLNETTNRGLIITRNLANYSSSALLVHDTLGMATFVNDAMKNEAVVYAALTDDHGTVLASNDISQVGQTFATPQGESPDLANLPQDASILIAKDPKTGKDILAFATSVTKNGIKIGQAQVALSQSAIQKVVESLTWDVAILVVFFLVLGVAASWILARLIVRPVSRLTLGAIAIGQGKLETRIQVPSRDELGILASSFNQMTQSLKQAQEDLLEKQRLQQELSIAQEIQKALLPKSTPQIKGYEIISFYQPAKEVGGDYYDFIPLSQNRLAFTVADVSGKGVPGSLGMTMARSVLRSQAFSNSLPGETLKKTNSVIEPDIRKGMFVTMFYCILDSVAHEIQCGNAGHNPALHLKAGKGVELVAPEGMALGLAPANMYFVDEFKLALQPGDSFVLYTDGVTEAMNPSRQEYGEQRFTDALLRYNSENLNALAKHLMDDINSFTQGSPQHDDITFLILRRLV